MLKYVLSIIAILALSACTVAPYKKPLPQEVRSRIEQPVVYAKVEDHGIGVRYFAQDSSVVGAQYGVIGALVTATIDAIANSGPLGIAQDGANRLALVFNHTEAVNWLQSGLRNSLVTETWFTKGIDVKSMANGQKVEANAFSDATVLAVALDYSLTQDLRSMQVTARAHVVSKAATELLANRADTTNSDKKAGLLYRNRFEYYSNPLPPAPEKTRAERDAKIAEIKGRYPPTRRTKRQVVAMNREIAEARGPMPPKDKADYQVKQWLADNGVKLTAEMQTGTAVVLDLLTKDLLDSASIDPKAKLPLRSIVEEKDGRVLIRYTWGVDAGVLSSEPKDFVIPPFNGVSYRKEPTAQKATAK